jgi:hypothetical protein
MTAAYTIATPPPFPPSGRLGDRLEQIHRQWLHDLREAVDKAEEKDSGIWGRWNAIRYVDTTFSGQFDRERGALERLSQIDESHVTQLWVAGELVTMLRQQLCHAVGLCHRAAEFTDITARLVRAVEYWFAEVEDIVGALDWADLSSKARQDIASLGTEQAPCWRDLPISLVTSL